MSNIGFMGACHWVDTNGAARPANEVVRGIIANKYAEDAGAISDALVAEFLAGWDEAAADPECRPGLRVR